MPGPFPAFPMTKREMALGTRLGTFAKPRRLHLVKGSDGLDHCPVTAVNMQDLEVKEAAVNM